MILIEMFVNSASLLVNLLIIYCSLNLIRVFKGGELEKEWLFVSIAGLLFAVSSGIFLLSYLLTLGAIRTVAGIVMLTGGISLLAGLRNALRRWTKRKP